MSKENITIGLVNEYNFCLMMPPAPGLNVGDTEGTSLARCFGSVPGSQAAGSLPDGFITSAHFISTKDYVQVSGNLDTSKWTFPPNDTGGQYDSAIWGSRPGSNCAGYSSYLQYLGPEYKIYCLRCCNNDEYCPASNDLAGCERGMSGTVFGPGFDSNGKPSTLTPPPRVTTEAPPSVPTGGSSEGEKTTKNSTSSGKRVVLSFGLLALLAFSQFI